MRMTSDIILSARGLRRTYGALHAVDGVDLDIRAGEAVGVGGPNGAGKTTLFDLISGVTPATAGEITFDGRVINGMNSQRLFQLGLARTFQVVDGFPRLSVLENMLVAQALGIATARRGLILRRRDRERAMASLDSYGLADIAMLPVAEISALQRKTLMVATATVGNPRMLMLDEPVGGLTPPEIDEFIKLIDRVRASGVTIVFIEHVMRFLTTVADRAVIMDQGGLIFDGAPGDMIRDETIRKLYLGEAPVTEDAHEPA